MFRLSEPDRSKKKVITDVFNNHGTSWGDLKKKRVSFRPAQAYHGHLYLFLRDLPVRRLSNWSNKLTSTKENVSMVSMQGQEGLFEKVVNTFFQGGGDLVFYCSSCAFLYPIPRTVEVDLSR